MAGAPLIGGAPGLGLLPLEDSSSVTLAASGLITADESVRTQIA
jgi:hypothetical protein